VAVLDGVLDRVTFCNPETGYTIARIAPDRGTGRGPVSAVTELVTAVGPLSSDRPFDFRPLPSPVPPQFRWTLRTIGNR
jgi:hypothetical protein